MWDWYNGSAVCLAYLNDVEKKTSRLDEDDNDDSKYEDNDENSNWIPELKKSSWFTRGWTLQELLAPSYVLFLDNGWSILGTKGSLAKHIVAVTGIGSTCLRYRANIFHQSVNTRMT